MLRPDERAARATVAIDIGGLNAFSRETLSYAADFLDRPRDEIGCLGVALDLFFLGVGLLADVGWQPSWQRRA